MKRSHHSIIALSLLLALLALAPAAMAEEGPTSLLGNGDIDWGVGGGFGYGVGSFFGDAKPWYTSHLTLYADKRLGIGFASFNPVTHSDLRLNGRDVEVDAHFGGLELSWACEPNRLLHTKFGASFGGGQLRAWDVLSHSEQEDNIAFVRPWVAAELNLTSWMKMHASGGYHLARGVDIAGASNEDLSGASATVGFSFGWY